MNLMDQGQGITTQPQGRHGPALVFGDGVLGIVRSLAAIQPGVDTHRHAAPAGEETMGHPGLTGQVGGGDEFGDIVGIGHGCLYSVPVRQLKSSV